MTNIESRVAGWIEVLIRRGFTVVFSGEKNTVFLSEAIDENTGEKVIEQIVSHASEPSTTSHIPAEKMLSVALWDFGHSRFWHEALRKGIVRGGRVAIIGTIRSGQYLRCNEDRFAKYSICGSAAGYETSRVAIDGSAYKRNVKTTWESHFGDIEKLTVAFTTEIKLMAEAPDTIDA